MGNKEEIIWKAIYPDSNRDAANWTHQAQWILELGQEKRFTELSQTKQEVRIDQIRQFLEAIPQSEVEIEEEEAELLLQDHEVYEDEDIDEDVDLDKEESDEWEEKDFDEFVPPSQTTIDIRRPRYLMPSEETRQPIHDDTSYQDAKAFHAAVQSIIKKLVQGGSWNHPVNLHYRVESGKPSAVRISSSLPKQKFYQFRCLISQILIEAQGQVLLCARRRCPNLFVRHRRQTYCSPRCAGLARIRRFRKQRKEMKQE